ncbi:unnamed protein product [Lactuca saligna]|uniref:Uncharacterized protein n=1 Tax=Lactuca saligna TaxID=75948 RepID=A0AA35ZVK4_LACSI|nr:unnamed protein product [Lactuca saligna]
MGLDSRLMDEYERELVDLSNIVDVNELDDYKITIGSNKSMEIYHNTSDLRKAIGYTYLASSYLRLFKESAENYTKKGNFLKEKFSDFYSFEGNWRCLEIVPLFKSTLYVILYASCKNTNGESLKGFLYKTHLKYTGLKSYLMFLKCMESLHINNKDLLNLMYAPMFKHQLKGIGDLMVMDHMKGNYALKMWKFGRIF